MNHMFEAFFVFLTKKAHFLKRKASLAPFIKCTGGQNRHSSSRSRIPIHETKIKDVDPNDLYCSHGQSFQSTRQTCREEPICPDQCNCNFSRK